MSTVHLPKCLAKGFGPCPIPMLVGDISIFARWTSQLSRTNPHESCIIFTASRTTLQKWNHYVVLRMPSYCDVHFRTYRFPKWPYGNAPFPDNTKYKLLAIDPAILYHYELWVLKWALSIAGKSSYPMRSPLFMLFPDVHILFFLGEKNPIQKPWWKVGDETMVKDHCEKMGGVSNGEDDYYC
jgi:hypothetical protein